MDNSISSQVTGVKFKTRSIQNQWQMRATNHPNITKSYEAEKHHKMEIDPQSNISECK